MYFFHGIITLFLAAVMYYDFTKYIIPNWICGVLLALYPVMLVMSPHLPEDFSVWISLAVAVALFAVGVVVFTFKWMGGGDVKLLTVLGLWAGAASALDLLLLIAVLGGLLALLLWLVRPAAGRVLRTTNPEELPQILRHGEPMPYGLAITSGFLILLWSGWIPGLPVEWSVF